MLETVSHEDQHNTFSGLVYQSDFNTELRGKNNYGGSIIAKRILSDRRFDEMCRKNAESRERRGEGWENLLQSRSSACEYDGNSEEIILRPGYYIEKEIKDMGLTRAEFAIRIGFSNAQLSSLLSGRTQITEKIAKTLARETEKSMDYWIDLQKEFNSTARKEEIDA